MKFWSDSFKDGEHIPAEFAFGAADANTHVQLSSNKNPQFAWSDLPEGTQSLVLVCHDGDVPSRGDDVNQEGKTVPADLPRVDFYHLTLVDLSPALTGIAAGALSSAVTPRGKAGPDVPGIPGARQGLNDFTGWFAGDSQMAGDYCGYDGPCPPWNDSLMHHYVFTLYALKTPRLSVEGKFTGQQATEAMLGQILGRASFTGLYSLNPAVKG